MRKMISLTVQADVDEGRTSRWNHLQLWFGSIYGDVVIKGFPSVNLSTQDLDGDDSGEEFFDEGTLLRVQEAIDGYVGSEVETREIINKLQNAGILFRERRPDKEVVVEEGLRVKELFKTKFNIEEEALVALLKDTLTQKFVSWRKPDESDPKFFLRLVRAGQIKPEEFTAIYGVHPDEADKIGELQPNKYGIVYIDDPAEKDKR